jgi:hypothetical protein
MKFSITDVVRASSDVYKSQAKLDELARVSELALIKVGLAVLGGKAVSIDLENGHHLVCEVRKANAKPNAIKAATNLKPRHRGALRRMEAELAPQYGTRPFMLDAREALEILNIRPAK